MKIHISGASGDLAQVCSNKLRQAGFSLVLYSRKKRKQFEPLSKLSSCAYISPDDTILHMAWSTLPALAGAKPGLGNKTDLLFIASLLRKINKKYKENKPHFIFFSSGGSIYGNANKHPSREIDNCKPLGAYGKAKLAAEKIIRNLDSGKKPFCTILRISNIYGQNLNIRRKQGIIHHAIFCALKNKQLSIWGDGRAQKDFLHVEDFFKALKKVIHKKQFGTFNICSGKSSSINDIIALVQKHANNKILCRYSKKKKWDVVCSRLDGSLAWQKLNWKPSLSVEQGIKKTILIQKRKIKKARASRYK